MAVAKTSLGVSALKGFCEAMRSAGCRLGSLAYGSSTCLLVLPPSCSGSQQQFSLGRNRKGWHHQHSPGTRDRLSQQLSVDTEPQADASGQTCYVKAAPSQGEG